MNIKHVLMTTALAGGMVALVASGASAANSSDTEAGVPMSRWPGSHLIGSGGRTSAQPDQTVYENQL